MDMEGGFRPWGMDKQNYLVLIHIAQLGGFITAGLGFVLPLVMWLSNRDQDREIDEHGRRIVNFSISMFIYFVIAVVLCLMLVGIPALIALFLLSFIFPIIGAIRASHGELYQYPLTIEFFK